MPMHCAATHRNNCIFLLIVFRFQLLLSPNIYICVYACMCVEMQFQLSASLPMCSPCLTLLVAPVTADKWTRAQVHESGTL